MNLRAGREQETQVTRADEIWRRDSAQLRIIADDRGAAKGVPSGVHHRASARKWIRHVKVPRHEQDPSFTPSHQCIRLAPRLWITGQGYSPAHSPKERGVVG